MRVVISFGPDRAELRQRWVQGEWLIVEFLFVELAHRFILLEKSVGDDGEPLVETRGGFANFEEARTELNRQYWPDSEFGKGGQTP